MCLYSIDEATQVKSLVQGPRATWCRAAVGSQHRLTDSGVQGPVTSPLSHSGLSFGSEAVRMQCSLWGLLAEVLRPCAVSESLAILRSQGSPDPEGRPLIPEQSRCRRARLDFLVLTLILSSSQLGINSCRYQEKQNLGKQLQLGTCDE